MAPEARRARLTKMARAYMSKTMGFGWDKRK